MPIRRLLKRIPYIEAFRAFLEQWGLWYWVAAAGGGAVSAAIAAWAWLESSLPHWGIALVFLSVFCLLIVCSERIQAMWSRHKTQTIDLPRSAVLMKQSVNEMRETLRRLQQTRSVPRQIKSESDSDFETRLWQTAREQEDDVSSQFTLRHRGNLVAHFRLIESIIGSEIPLDVKTSIHHRPLTAIYYIEAVSDLLAEGHVEEIKKMDGNFLFYIIH